MRIGNYLVPPQIQAKPTRVFAPDGTDIPRTTTFELPPGTQLNFTIERSFPASGSLPAGQAVTIRLSEDVADPGPGQVLTGRLEQTLAIDADRVIAPAGAIVRVSVSRLMTMVNRRLVPTCTFRLDSIWLDNFTRIQANGEEVFPPKAKDRFHLMPVVAGTTLSFVIH